MPDGDAADAALRRDEPQQRIVSERLARLIDNSPGIRDLALEVGVIDRRWLAEPSRHRPAVAPPVELLRRFVERAVESYPSALASIGLSALQVLSWDLFWDRGLRASRDTVGAATVVFTDLEGFTRFTARRGDEAARSLLEQHHRTTAPLVRRWDGRVVKHLGDGLMLTFPEASAAVHAALELLPTAPAPLRMRAGVHTGAVVATGDDLLGHAVNLAARVAAAAHGDQVLVTAAALAAAGPLPGVKVSRARRRRLKGIAGRVTVAAVTRDGNAADGGARIR